MKTTLFVLTFAVGVLSILDRSYYDSLCTSNITQNCLLVPVHRISEMPFANYLKNIILIETLDQGNDSRRSTLVLNSRFSI